MNEKVLITSKRSAEISNLVQGLKSIGIQVRLLTDGRMTLERLDEQCPAAIIIDNELPDRSGLDLCRIIKTEERTRSVFVLLLVNDLTYQREGFELA